MDDFPPPLTPAEAEALRRRQRSKNWALLLALATLAGLFYAISVVRMDATLSSGLPSAAGGPR